MTRFPHAARLWAFVVLAFMAPIGALAAPFAAYVMDARTGQPIYTQNADTRLHPASLTKMMTLYLAFSAIERGQVRLDSQFLVSTNAANEPPSKLGLRAGQRIELRYLIRAAAIKSANDAATTIGEGLAGSEDAFAQQMTATARALGMRNTTFRNANGLTQEGHYSTAQDMSILGRHLLYDFPQYYNLFSRRAADAGIAQVSSTNKRFLDSYEGADGIKTGYTRAAGFNLTASAKRGNKRIVATVLGGTSTAQRNQVMAQLLDAGFARVPNRVREVAPEAPRIAATKVVRRAQVEPRQAATQADPRRLSLQASAPPRRIDRSSLVASAAVAPTPTPAAIPASIPPAPNATAGMTLSASARPTVRPGAAAAAVAESVAASMAASSGGAGASLAAPVLDNSSRPRPSPRRSSAAAVTAPATPAEAPAQERLAEAPITPGTPAQVLPTTLVASSAPAPRSDTVILAAMGEGDIASPEATEFVARPSNSGRSWGVDLGLYPTQNEADRLLLRTALQDGDILDGGRRSVADTRRGFAARFSHLTRASAELTCERLRARQQDCAVTGP